MRAIRIYLAERNLRQKDLAALIPISRNQLSAIMNYKVHPSPLFIMRLWHLSAKQITPNDILFDEGYCAKYRANWEASHDAARPLGETTHSAKILRLKRPDKSKRRHDP